MKKSAFVLVFLFLVISAVRGGGFGNGTSLIPYPSKVSFLSGSFSFSDKTVIVVENLNQKVEAEKFIKLFEQNATFKPTILLAPEKGNVILSVDKSIGKESYKIDVSRKKIDISASTSEGFYYAFQTLRQMLPYKNMSDGKKAKWQIPAMSIEDSPRFEYRGVMLDAARFFIPKEEVIKIIDCMGMLKLNNLHLHLVDDNGWRIEIKKYPLLTKVGSRRVERGYVEFPSRKNPRQGEKTVNKGFYTQEDIKEIVKYAADNHINVIPEIEMPAHSNSALASYPELACPVVDKYIGVLPGLGGHNSDIIYCAGNEKVFTFLEDVIDEVIQLFPSEYIHIGGDEAKKTNWNKCPLCQKRIEDEHLNNSEELQGYFMKRIAKYINSKGRKVIGWDELTNSSMPDGAVIMGWQGMGQAALKAARLGHKFIMTPAKILYLIRYQGPQWFEPLTYFGNNTLKDVYCYEPVEKGWNKDETSLLMGVQASLWTEFCNSTKDVEYLIFPRLVAFSEVGWINNDKKDWRRFLSNLDVFKERLSAMNITYAKSMYNIQHYATANNGKINISMECIRPDVEIRYTLDGKNPSAKSRLYKTPFDVEKSILLKAATFQNGKQMGQTLELQIVWNKACTKPVYTSNCNNINLLVNGLEGSDKYTDGEWCNWNNNDSAQFVIDLLSVQKIQKTSIGINNNYGMGVHAPRSIQISISNDNKNWQICDSVNLVDSEIFLEGIWKKRLDFTVNGSARYIRVKALGAGKLPCMHVREGQDSRFYFDEVRIE